MKIAILIFTIFSVFSQTTYYTSQDGLDSATCGDASNPCSSINQVFTNHPGESFTLLIEDGTYTTNAIILQRDAFVIFQGGVSTTVTASWRNGTFLTNTAASGFEIHDVSLILSGTGTIFSEFFTSNNSGGFFNVLLQYSGYAGNFVSVNGGTLIVSNVTFNKASFNGYFILASARIATSVVVENSTISNVVIGGNTGGIVVYDVYNGADSGVNTSTFQNITSPDACIEFWARNSNQTISITYSYFFDISANLPTVYAVNTFQSTIYLTNVTWVNASSRYSAGALEIDGPSDGQDHGIVVLETLNFESCTGPSAGAIFIAYSSFSVNNSAFFYNTGIYANDVVQQVVSSSSTYGYVFTNTCSNSPQPRAFVISDDGTGQTDISDQIPSCRCLTHHHVECREMLDGLLIVPTDPLLVDSTRNQ